MQINQAIMHINPAIMLIYQAIMLIYQAIMQIDQAIMCFVFQAIMLIYEAIMQIDQAIMRFVYQAIMLIYQAIMRFVKSSVARNRLASIDIHTEETCPICMESLDPRYHQHTPCGHLFHTVCIRQWKQIRSNCPMCRNDLQ
jgi:hypothetical protein